MDPKLDAIVQSWLTDKTMFEAGFEKNNLSWQWELIKRQFVEWLILKLQNVKIPLTPFSISPRLLEALFWGLVLIFVTWAVWRLVPLFRTSWFALKDSTDSSLQWISPAQSQEYTVAEWLKQAQQLQQNGKFTEACRALYMAMLQGLHDTEIIQHDPSRSDGEYSQLIQQLPKINPYQTLLDTHEKHCFGNTQGSSETFTICQQAYQEIDPS
jgi:hypothetical protein